ncbi:MULTISPECIES: WecB/TagA/CpsF family glycosyltransferase [unclassified Luteococcus]|uniref:WecB/TagA/CpsF family glycosyltransferase n=1 Tax=unclassified Luteococcus TaxID=2639923 RepID=UPI00313E5B4A
MRIHALTWRETVDVVMTELDRGRGGLLLTANVDIMYRMSRPDASDLRTRATMIVPDGMPLVWASRLQGTPLPERVTGADLVWHLSEAASRRGRTVFLLGAGPGIAERAGQEFVRQYPGLELVGTECPPFGFEKDEAYLARLKARLLELQPDLVFVALGFPKQERVALELMPTLPGAWFMGCGGALDMAAGQTPRAHPTLQKLGAEWLHRLGLEPRRMAKRYLVDDVPYAARMVAASAVKGLRRKR